MKYQHLSKSIKNNSSMIDWFIILLYLIFQGFARCKVLKRYYSIIETNSSCLPG
nr:MAG TPA: hypothetical protein [Caudoviricetes sp.]